MDINSIRLIREKYLDFLATDAEYNNIMTSLSEKPESDPITNITDTEPESDLSFNTEQRHLSEILLDLHSINNAIKETKDNVVDIINSLDNSLAAIHSSIKQQIDQVNDINMLCGQESIYNMIVPIYVSDFGDTSAEMLDTKTIGASLINSSNVNYDIINVSGNGYSGNNFVYEDGEFVADFDDRSKIEYIADQNSITIYEYSRLCANKKQYVSSQYINYDNEPVECTVTLSAAKEVCKAKIYSSDESLCITKLETSSDGVRYINRLKEPLYINDVSQIYNNSYYIYGSNILCFPYSKFVRITFSNKEATNEDIRIVKDDTLYILDAKRKKIGISGIELYSSVYEEAVLMSQDIVEDGNIDKISLFVSEYIPDHFPENEYIQYFLILNGQEYKVVPANTGNTGIKLIKYTDDEKTASDTIELLTEAVHTVRIKVIITPFNNKETPYVSNIKLCIGKNTGDIYV